MAEHEWPILFDLEWLCRWENENSLRDHKLQNNRNIPHSGHPPPPLIGCANRRTRDQAKLTLIVAGPGFTSPLDSF